VLAGPRIHDDFVAALTEQTRSTSTTYANSAATRTPSSRR
jgi:betaine-aldehyde dehydrogenase